MIATQQKRQSSFFFLSFLDGNLALVSLGGSLLGASFHTILGVKEAGRVSTNLPPSANRRGDVTATLYGYLVVHVVNTSAIWRWGAIRLAVRSLRDLLALLSITTRRRYHFQRVRHLECSHKGHGSPPVFTGRH